MGTRSINLDPESLGFAEGNVIQRFGNRYLRFGEMPGYGSEYDEDSGNSTSQSWALNASSGVLYSPEYFDLNSQAWLKGTYNFQNFGVALGIGGNGEETWNLEGGLYHNQYSATNFYGNSGGGSFYGALRSATIDDSGLVVDGDLTYGSFTWTGIFDFSPVSQESSGPDPDNITLAIKRTYTLGADSKYLRERTTITNIDAEGDLASNLRFWTGVGDDYVAGVDSNDKLKGNIRNGSFDPLPSIGENGYYANDNQSTQSKIVLVGGNVPGVSDSETGPKADDSSNAIVEFFYTNAEFGYALIGEDYNWGFDESECRDTTLRRNPLDSDSRIDNEDGSYAMYYRLPDLATGKSISFDTYFAIGLFAELDDKLSSIEEAVIQDFGKDDNRTAFEIVVNNDVNPDKIKIKDPDGDRLDSDSFKLVALEDSSDPGETTFAVVLTDAEENGSYVAVLRNRELGRIEVANSSKRQDCLDALFQQTRSADKKPRIDTITGTPSGDLIALGNSDDAFYARRDKRDFALVRNFEPGDRLQLHGDPDQYKFIADTTVAGKSGMGLTYNGDLIAILRGSDTAFLRGLADNLGSSSFQFV